MKRIATAVAVAVALTVSATATMAASKPTVATGSASGQTDTSATINGTVNPNGQSTTYSFQYGTTNTYGQQTAPASVGSDTTTHNVSASLSNLTPGTTYHYRVIATNASGTSVGADATFSTTGTPPTPVTAPTVATKPATSVQSHGATVNGTVNPNGHPVKVYFEFGLTQFYGVQTLPKTVPAGSSSVNVNAALTGLEASQTYHYRLVAQDVNGNTVVGADKTFRTGAAGQAPTLRNISVRPNAFRAARGGTVSYNDSQRATTTIIIERIAQGVKRGGRCVAPRPGASSGARCTRFIRVRRFTHADRAGRNRFHLGGLARGRYRMTAQAHNSKGTSPRKRVRFRVI